MAARVAYVIHHLDPGGAERRLLAVADGLERSRFQPLVVCIDRAGGLSREAAAAGLEPIVLGRTRRLDARGVVRLERTLRRERVDVVHGWLSLGNLFARVAGTLAHVPVRVAAEGGTLTTTDPRRARRDVVVERALAPLTDAYVANSEAVAASLREKGVPGEKIVVIHNGVAAREPLSSAERGALRSGLGASEGEALLGMVARLDPGFKDHATFLGAVAALVAEGRPVRAAVIGDGPGRATLERRAVELGLADRVTFTGYRPDAARVVGALDVSVLLTYSEGFSNVILETMTAGVPLVATAIEPNREAVEDGVQGLLVPVGDLDATTAALRRLLDDRGLGAALAGEARRRALEQFSLRAQAEATMRLYERLLEAKRATL